MTHFFNLKIGIILAIKDSNKGCIVSDDGQICRYELGENFTSKVDFYFPKSYPTKCKKTLFYN